MNIKLGDIISIMGSLIIIVLVFIAMNIFIPNIFFFTIKSIPFIAIIGTCISLSYLRFNLKKIKKCKYPELPSSEVIGVLNEQLVGFKMCIKLLFILTVVVLINQFLIRPNWNSLFTLLHLAFAVTITINLIAIINIYFTRNQFTHLYGQEGQL